jgi:hypothetical protein
MINVVVSGEFEHRLGNAVMEVFAEGRGAYLYSFLRTGVEELIFFEVPK